MNNVFIGGVKTVKKTGLDTLRNLKKNEQAVLIESFNDADHDVYAIYVNGEYDRRIKVKKSDKKYLRKK